jgi:hypothetical protein
VSPTCLSLVMKGPPVRRRRSETPSIRFAWSLGGDRCYGLRKQANGFTVLTTLTPSESIGGPPAVAA